MLPLLFGIAALPFSLTGGALGALRREASRRAAQNYHPRYTSHRVRTLEETLPQAVIIPERHSKLRAEWNPALYHAIRAKVQLGILTLNEVPRRFRTPEVCAFAIHNYPEDAGHIPPGFKDRVLQ